LSGAMAAAAAFFAAELVEEEDVDVEEAVGAADADADAGLALLPSSVGDEENTDVVVGTDLDLEWLIGFLAGENGLTSISEADGGADAVVDVDAGDEAVSSREEADDETEDDDDVRLATPPPLLPTPLRRWPGLLAPLAIEYEEGVGQLGVDDE
jgi:hypothetical protein